MRGATPYHSQANIVHSNAGQQPPATVTVLLYFQIGAGAALRYPLPATTSRIGTLAEWQALPSIISQAIVVHSIAGRQPWLFLIFVTSMLVMRHIARDKL